MFLLPNLSKAKALVFTPFASHMTNERPRSILEIPRGREVAIKTPSFSLFARFMGVRLGWTVVPKNYYI